MRRVMQEVSGRSRDETGLLTPTAVPCPLEHTAFTDYGAPLESSDRRRLVSHRKTLKTLL